MERNGSPAKIPDLRDFDRNRNEFPTTGCCRLPASTWHRAPMARAFQRLRTLVPNWMTSSMLRALASTKLCTTTLTRIR